MSITLTAQTTAQMEGRHLQYLSRMGVDVWRRRDQGAATATDSAAVDGQLTSAQAATHEMATAEQAPRMPAPQPNPGEVHPGDARSAHDTFDAHWVQFDDCVVIAAEPSKLIEDVVCAFAGETRRASESEWVPDAGSLAQRLTTFEGVVLVFGEAISRALAGEFVPHDIQSLGACRFVCAQSPAAYAANPIAKRHLWRALCQLRASIESETAAG